ncbi:hypothetical protein ACFSQ0_00985 [Mesonia sediminis]|uniref:Uncharacterized protein n=1 Tax=Mesonia sediminis TaxID=1703946 RepID=A0ABW5S9W3_9FLAO
MKTNPPQELRVQSLGFTFKRKSSSFITWMKELTSSNPYYANKALFHKEMNL